MKKQEDQAKTPETRFLLFYQAKIVKNRLRLDYGGRRRAFLFSKLL